MDQVSKLDDVDAILPNQALVEGSAVAKISISVYARCVYDTLFRDRSFDFHFNKNRKSAHQLNQDVK